MSEPNWSTPPGTIIDGYDATPPATNEKCIVFTLACALGYWYLPPKNPWVLAMLLYFPYLIMAWYDHLYNCERRMGPTFLGTFYFAFKPPYNDKGLEWHPKWKRLVFMVDMVLLMALGLYYRKSLFA